MTKAVPNTQLRTLFRIVGQFESQGLKFPYFPFLAVFDNLKFSKGLKSKQMSIPFDLSHFKPIYDIKSFKIYIF